MAELFAVRSVSIFPYATIDSFSWYPVAGVLIVRLPKARTHRDCCTRLMNDSLPTARLLLKGSWRSDRVFNWLAIHPRCVRKSVSFESAFNKSLNLSWSIKWNSRCHCRQKQSGEYGWTWRWNSKWTTGNAFWLHTTAQSSDCGLWRT